MSAGRAPGAAPPVGTRRVTAGLIALVSLIAFEALGVATAMPVVAQDLDAVRSYALAFSLFLTAALLGTVLAGGWADARGPRPAVLTGLGLFCLGLLICGAAPTFAVLLAGRGISGLGAGFLVVALYVVIARCYPQSDRPRVFGWVSAAWVLPSALGPPVAGWLAVEVGWRAVFLAVPPLVLAGALVLLPVLRRAEGGDPAGGSARRALLGTAVAAGALALQWAAQGRGPGPLLLAAVLAGSALLAVAVPRLLPAGTMRAASGIAAVVATRGLLTGSFFAAETFVPLALVRERGLSPAVAGLALTGAACGWFVGAWLQGRSRLPVTRPTLLALGALTVALAVASLGVVVLDAVPPLLVVPLWAVAGVGMGLGMSSTSVLLLGLSAPGEEGRNSAALQLSDTLGSVLGVGAAGAVFAALHTADGADGGVYALIWAGAAALGAVAALAGRRSRPAPARGAPRTVQPSAATPR